MTAVAARPAFRRPWQDGAKAYHEADSVAAIFAGLGRLRNPLTVLIHHEGHALDGVACDVCGFDLAGAYPAKGSDEPDSYAMIDVDPRNKTYVARHYICAWSSTLTEVAKLRHRMDA